MWNRFGYVCLLSLFATQAMAVTTKGISRKNRLVSSTVKTRRVKKVTPTTRKLFGDEGTFKGAVAIAGPSRPVTE
jgi:hypothetical protein